MKMGDVREVAHFFPGSNLHLRPPPNHIEQIATIAQGRDQYPRQFAVNTLVSREPLQQLCRGSNAIGGRFLPYFQRCLGVDQLRRDGAVDAGHRHVSIHLKPPLRRVARCCPVPGSPAIAPARPTAGSPGRCCDANSQARRQGPCS